jgi:hypothetical protein
MEQKRLQSDCGYFHVLGYFALAASLLLLFIIGGCYAVGHSILCIDSVRSEAKSPDGRYIAETVETDCGATEHGTVIRVRRNRPFFSDKREVLATSGGHNMRITWDGNQRLIISCPDCTGRDSTRDAESKWRDVLVRCELSARKD